MALDEYDRFRKYGEKPVTFLRQFETVHRGEKSRRCKMVTVTEGAKEELQKALSSANVADPELGLRVVREPTGRIELVLDREREGDQVVEHEGSKVLLIDKEMAVALQSLTIACEERPEGRCLVVLKE
jgi:Fe-S cluster assembly iron-binding protein IscA